MRGIFLLLSIFLCLSSIAGTNILCADANNDTITVKDDKPLTLEERVNQGDSLAMYIQGALYFKGYDNYPKDKKRAAQLFRMSAEKHYVEGMKIYAWCLATGYGVPRDTEASFQWYHKISNYEKEAAEQGDTLAMKWLSGYYKDIVATADAKEMAILLDSAYTLSRSGNIDKADVIVHNIFKELNLQRNASSGDVKDVYALARYYDDLHVTEHDSLIAASYIKTAKVNYLDSYVRLGKCYEQGRGVAKDGTKAMHCYSQGVSNGSAEAMLHLAMAYEKGITGKPNYEMAAKWYTTALRETDIEVLKKTVSCLASCYANGKGVSKDEDIASVLNASHRAFLENKPLEAQRLISVALDKIDTDYTSLIIGGVIGLILLLIFIKLIVLRRK